MQQHVSTAPCRGSEQAVGLGQENLIILRLKAVAGPDGLLVNKPGPNQTWVNNPARHLTGLAHSPWILQAARARL